MLTAKMDRRDQCHSETWDTACEDTTSVGINPPDRDGAADVAMDSVDVERVRLDCGLYGTMNITSDDTTSIEMDSGTGVPVLEQDQSGPFDSVSRNAACTVMEPGSTIAPLDGVVTPLPTTITPLAQERSRSHGLRGELLSVSLLWCWKCRGWSTAIEAQSLRKLVEP